MKILVATGLYPPEIGGPATHIEILERELPQKGIQIISLPYGTVRKYPKIFRHGMYAYLLFKKSKDVSIIYALDPVSVGLPALLISRITRKKFVLRVAGDYAWEQAVGRYGVTAFLDQFVEEISSQRFMVRILAYIERFVARRADIVIVPSHYLRTILGKWGVTEKVVVVPNAFAPLHVTETKEEIRTMFGYTGTVITSAGRLVPWKGFRTLISAVAELHTTHPDLMCVIVGDGPEHDALHAHAKALGVENAIRFVDRQPKEALAVAIKGSDMFVLNTAYEGFSHQLLEVMALGVPIITTNVGGNTELFHADGKFGLLVTYDNLEELKAMILRVIEGGAASNERTMRAKEHAESFTIDRMVEGVHTVFKEVTKGEK